MRLLTRADLLELLRDGEGSAVEFKEDIVRPEQVAKEIVALANLDGGLVLLGVRDDGSLAGLDRPDVEEWVMSLCRTHVRPELLPGYQLLRDVEPGKDVAVVHVPRSGMAHALWHNQKRQWVIRVGSTSRDASESELQRLFQQRGQVRYEKLGLPGTSLDDLDRRRLRHYFERIRELELPDADDEEQWKQLLVNTELMSPTDGEPTCTVAAVLLFGLRPRVLLPQHGIHAASFPGVEKDYAVIERAYLDAPLVALVDDQGQVVEPGLVEQALAFTSRNLRHRARIEQGRRLDEVELPLDAVREATVNALIHRDWLLSGTDVELNVHPDRLELVSPGRLPNGVTPEKMRVGLRFSRNPLLRDIMRDHGYLEAMGLGVPRKIVKLMRERVGVEVDLVEDREAERFTVVLPRPPAV